MAVQWLFDEVFDKYSYTVYIKENEGWDGLFVEIDIKPEYRLEPEDDTEENHVDIPKEKVIKALLPLIGNSVNKYLRRHYKNMKLEKTSWLDFINRE